jgi:hypothetical protein
MVNPRHPDMESAADLNPTDHDILDLLQTGRETTGSLARQLEKHPNYVRDRVRLMRMNGWVAYHDEPTALHELQEDPR